MSSVLLLSGGLDSIAIASWLLPARCITIDYGQVPAQAEISASREVCKTLGIPHHVLSVSLPSLGSGVLSGQETSPVSENPEFWPYRNQFIITIASMYAVKNDLSKVLIGTVSSDKRHADGQPRFVSKISELVAMQEGGVEVNAPALELTTDELIKASGVTPDVLGWAHSCHSSNLACGNCPGCFKHTEIMGKIGWER